MNRALERVDNRQTGWRSKVERGWNWEGGKAVDEGREQEAAGQSALYRAAGVDTRSP